MSRYWNTGGNFAQPSAAELRMKAASSVKAAAKRGRVYEPVHPAGKRNQICVSWWGRAWCANLERYADYGSRLDRGRRYVMNGTVLDLQIRKGHVEARVQGSRRTPYKVEIRISPLSEAKCQRIIASCGNRIGNLERLAAGEFPPELSELFMKEDGLFPAPKEISFSCSCPDWALMCKHVAAAMYGIGVRFDDNPFFFFELRGIDPDRLIDVAIEDRVERMLANADCVTQRVMDADMHALFGL